MNSSPAVSNVTDTADLDSDNSLTRCSHNLWAQISRNTESFNHSLSESAVDILLVFSAASPHGYQKWFWPGFSKHSFSFGGFGIWSNDPPPLEFRFGWVSTSEGCCRLRAKPFSFFVLVHFRLRRVALAITLTLPLPYLSLSALKTPRLRTATASRDSEFRPWIGMGVLRRAVYLNLPWPFANMQSIVGGAMGKWIKLNLTAWAWHAFIPSFRRQHERSVCDPFGFDQQKKVHTTIVYRVLPRMSNNVSRAARSPFLAAANLA